jgi:lactobin A/cerein 7B family class IIb bacteriocin
MKKSMIKESNEFMFNNLQELTLQDMTEIDGGGFPWKKVAIITAISPLAGVTYGAGYLVGRYDAKRNGC